MKIEILGYCTLSLWEDEYKDVEISRDMVRIFKHNDSIKTIRIRDYCDNKLNECKIYTNETSIKKAEKQGNISKVENDPRRIKHPPHDHTEGPCGICSSSSTRIKPEAQKNPFKDHSGSLASSLSEKAAARAMTREQSERPMGIFSSLSTRTEPETQRLMSNLNDLTEKIQKLEISDNNSTLYQPKIVDSGLRVDLLPSARARKTQSDEYFDPMGPQKPETCKGMMSKDCNQETSQRKTNNLFEHAERPKGQGLFANPWKG